MLSFRCFVRRCLQAAAAHQADESKVIPMIETSPANLDLTIVLPLGVVANQLMKIEADLRFLNMKALVRAKDRENTGLTTQIAVRLDKVNEALDRIRALILDIEADIQPKPASAVHRVSKDRDD
jgi:hypothetical protein